MIQPIDRYRVETSLHGCRSRLMPSLYPSQRIRENSMFAVTAHHLHIGRLKVLAWAA